MQFTKDELAEISVACLIAWERSTNPDRRNVLASIAEKAKQGVQEQAALEVAPSFLAKQP